jgi:hypothetical protein
MPKKDITTGAILLFTATLRASLELASPNFQLSAPTPPLNVQIHGCSARRSTSSTDYALLCILFLMTLSLSGQHLVREDNGQLALRHEFEIAQEAQLRFTS